MITKTKIETKIILPKLFLPKLILFSIQIVYI
jgi:hypothetical protein